MSVITDLLTNSIGTAIKDVISSIKADPTVKAQLEAQIQENQGAILQKSMDVEQQLNDIAGQNIRAEETSTDNYTKRGRPTVIYGGLFMFFWNWCLVPIVGAHWHLPTMEIPSLFIETWGVVVTGYVFARGAENISSMPGNSSIKLPGIQIQQNSSK